MYLLDMVATINLNTSHVILYRNAAFHRDSSSWNLNTSHVILYPRNLGLCRGGNVI